MATAEKPFIRQDGKDKVTGLGRYTADLGMTGMLQAKFRYADHAHARIRASTPPRPGRCRRVRRDHARGRARRPLRPLRPGPAPVRQDQGALRGRAGGGGGRARRPRSPSEACELIEVDYEPLEVVYDVEAALQPGAPLLHEDWADYGASEDVVREGNDCSRSTIVKGDADKGMAEADIGRQGALRRRHVARRSDRAARDRRPVAGRQGHRSGRRRRCRTSPEAASPPRSSCPRPRPHHRAAPRRRLRRQVRVPL